MKSSTASTFVTLALALSQGTLGQSSQCVRCFTCKSGGQTNHVIQCDSLANEKSLKGKVWGPSDSRYDDRLAQYYSANAALAPWCMVVPENTKDVSKVMKVLSKHDCPFGMRSGAHAAFKGSNSIKDGVTIDLGSYPNFPPSQGISTDLFRVQVT